MSPNATPDIPQLADHPDLATLRDYDHPPRSVRRWRATLAAKAWLGSELVCFFVGRELAERYVVFFQASKTYRPRFHGADMRMATIGAAFELDVFVAARTRAIADAVLPIRAFP